MANGVVVISEVRRKEFDERRLVSVRIQFVERVQSCIDQEVVLYQSRSATHPSGYFAVAKLLDGDISVNRRNYLSLTFAAPVYLRTPVSLQADGHVLESYVISEKGGVHGRRASEDFRTIPAVEFNAIVASEIFEHSPLNYNADGLAEVEKRIRERVARESWLRSTKVRAMALPVYDFQCAISRQKLLSIDGSRSGLHVCHAKSVAAGGPDEITNLVPLSPDFHSRFDEGTIDILDDYSWMPVGKHHDAVVREWKGPRQLIVPKNPAFRLDRNFLAEHRQEIFMRYGIDCRSQY